MQSDALHTAGCQGSSSGPSATGTTARVEPRRAKAVGKPMMNRCPFACSPCETEPWADSKTLSRPFTAFDSLPDNDIFTQTPWLARRRRAD